MTMSTQPIVQISLNLTTIEEALDHARKAVRAGVDWLEAGTPLILGEGLHAVQALRREFPDYPVVADLKTMDGGYLEAEMMAKAGATHVVVMARSHPATIKVVVKAGRDYGVKVMGDDLGCEDKPAASRMMQDLGVDYIVHHVGYDERRDPAVIAAHGGVMPSPLERAPGRRECCQYSCASGRRPFRGTGLATAAVRRLSSSARRSPHG